MEPTKPGVSMWLWVSLIIVVLIGGGFFGWYYLMGPGKKVAATTTTTPTTAATTTPTTATTTDTSDVSSWLTYTNTRFGYTIKYPSNLKYTEEEGTKYMHFYTAAEASALAACQARSAESECNPGNEIHIAGDVNGGTTNADNLTNTLEEIINARVAANILSGPESTTLDKEVAYEGLSLGMLTDYDLISKFNNHMFDITLTCSAEPATLAACKAAITPTQQKMIDSFKFTR